MLSGKIVSLSRQKEVRGVSKYMKEITLIENVGIEGNVFQGGNRQVCVFSSEAHKWMQEQSTPGLCFKHFSENILTEGFPLDALDLGDMMAFGDARLQVSEKKPCFDECELRSNHLPCKLSENAFFATVEKGGVVKLEDKVYTVDK